MFIILSITRPTTQYIPVIAATIVERGLTEHFHLAGVAIGNGLTEPMAMATTMADSYYSLGLIDGSQRATGRALQNDCVAKARAGEWTAATTARDKVRLPEPPRGGKHPSSIDVLGCCANILVALSMRMLPTPSHLTPRYF